MSDDTYIVACLDSEAGTEFVERGILAPYHLATRQVFATRAEAEAYAGTVAPSRSPVVVAGRWHQLRMS